MFSQKLLQQPTVMSNGKTPSVLVGKLIENSQFFQFFQFIRIFSFQNRLSFQLATVLSRFSSQFCRSRVFAHAIANIAYDERFEVADILDDSKTFILNVDQILHQLCNFDGYITSNTIRPRIQLAERQFLANLKYLPHSQDSIRRNTNFYIELNLNLLNSIEKYVNLDSWIFPENDFINEFSLNEGRELPLLSIEKQLKVRHHLKAFI